jgi:hypothetical protein
VRCRARLAFNLSAMFPKNMRVDSPAASANPAGYFRAEGWAVPDPRVGCVDISSVGTPVTVRRWRGSRQFRAASIGFDTCFSIMFDLSALARNQEVLRIHNFPFGVHPQALGNRLSAALDFILVVGRASLARDIGGKARDRSRRTPRKHAL